MQFADNAGPDQPAQISLRRSACAFAQADQDRSCSLTESMYTVVYVDEQTMLRSDCWDAHAHLELRCLHMA